MSVITIDDFEKVEIRIGTVLEAEKVPDADRLIKLVFDFGTYQSQPSVVPVHPSGNEGDSSPSVQNDENEISHPDKIVIRNDNEGEIARNDSILPELAEKYPGREVRQIMSAIAGFYPDPSVLVGKQIAVCVNLEPRKFRGYESQGMIMATGTLEEGIVLMVPEKKVEPGAKIH